MIFWLSAQDWYLGPSTAGGLLPVLTCSHTSHTPPHTSAWHRSRSRTPGLAGLSAWKVRRLQIVSSTDNAGKVLLLTVDGQFSFNNKSSGGTGCDDSLGPAVPSVCSLSWERAVWWREWPRGQHHDPGRHWRTPGPLPPCRTGRRQTSPAGFSAAAAFFCACPWREDPAGAPGQRRTAEGRGGGVTVRNSRERENYLTSLSSKDFTVWHVTFFSSSSSGCGGLDGSNLEPTTSMTLCWRTLWISSSAHDVTISLTWGNPAFCRRAQWSREMAVCTSPALSSPTSWWWREEGLEEEDVSGGDLVTTTVLWLSFSSFVKWKILTERIITLSIIDLPVRGYLLFEHFLGVLVVSGLSVISHLPGQKPTMKTVGVSVASE